MKTFYITTPIYYANDKAHVGHAYTTILADVIARTARAIGKDAFFLTGLDEHGQKMDAAAKARNITPMALCDEMNVHWQSLWKKLNISNDDFIRTTEERHEKIVMSILQELYDKGEIYLDAYEGWYCVICERFWTQKDITESACPECNREVSKITEKNYFFRMGKYQQWLMDYIHAHPDFIRPQTRKNEVLGFLEKPLGDLCISRPKDRMAWGIPLPFDKDYVTYVWFDALINYISVPGYGTEGFNEKWPADYHLIGKDIVTTHAVYWPTMLKAMNLPMPKTILAHGWWLSSGSKMSKSVGNVVNPMDYIDLYGIDAVRYYLMREMSIGQDANFTNETFLTRYNTELANDLGNLISRTTSMIHKYFEGKIPDSGPTGDLEHAIKEKAEKVSGLISELPETLAFHHYLESLNELMREANRYVEQRAPWTLAKDPDQAQALATVMYTLAETLRILAHGLSSIMPHTSEKILDILGFQMTGANLLDLLHWGLTMAGQTVIRATPLFPKDITCTS